MPEIEAVHPPADRLAAYALGRLRSPEMDEIEQHLSACDSCFQTIRDQPEDSLIANLRAGGAAPVAVTVLEEESDAEKPTDFQIPSSFVIGPAAAGFVQDQSTFAGPAPAKLPKELTEHPRYPVVAELGAGGMGTVYRAEHRLMDRPVALKIIRGDLLGSAALVERFRREAKAAARARTRISWPRMTPSRPERRTCWSWSLLKGPTWRS